MPPHTTRPRADATQSRRPGRKPAAGREGPGPGHRATRRARARATRYKAGARQRCPQRRWNRPTGPTPQANRAHRASAPLRAALPAAGGGNTDGGKDSRRSPERSKRQVHLQLELGAAPVATAGVVAGEEEERERERGGERGRSRERVLALGRGGDRRVRHHAFAGLSRRDTERRSKGRRQNTGPTGRVRASCTVSPSPEEACFTRREGERWRSKGRTQKGERVGQPDERQREREGGQWGGGRTEWWCRS